MAKQSRNMQEALRYHSLGWSVIPLKRNKRPYLESWKEFQLRLSTEQEIKDWWEKWPDANIGIVTGAVSGIIVLDVDSEKAAEYIKEKGMPPTPRCKTGKGTHYYMKHPGGHVPNKVNSEINLDVRGDGGYVVAPPSLHENGKLYEWEKYLNPWDADVLPTQPWMMDYVTESVEMNKQHKNPPGWSLEALEGVDEGSRNDTCAKLAGYLIRMEASDSEAIESLLTWNQKNLPPLEEPEVIRTYQSIKATHQRNHGLGSAPCSVSKLNSDGHQATRGSEISTKSNEGLRETKGGKRFNALKYSKRISEINDLIFKPDDGLYEYLHDKGYWKRIHENYIEGLALEMINGEATSFRIADVRKLVERSNLIPRDRDFDDQTEFINLRNGMFSTKTRELVSHDKDFYSTIQLNVTYDPEAKCLKWEQFLLEIFDEDVELFDLVQEFIGYSLIPDTRFEKALLLLGEGANGKSTLIKVWEELVGRENISSVILSGLQNDFHRVTLHRKLLNITAEINPMSIQQSDYFKRIVSGDTIDASHKFKPVFNFRPYARLVFAMNRLPRVKDTSHGYYRRLLIVPFNRTFDGDNADRELSSKLLTELDGIFLWALQGLNRLYEKETFTEPPQVSKMLEEYKRANNPLVAFVEDSCELDMYATTSKEKIYEEYKAYAENYGYVAMSANIFFRELYAAFPDVKATRLGSRGHRENHVQGIRVVRTL